MHPGRERCLSGQPGIRFPSQYLFSFCLFLSLLPLTHSLFYPIWKHTFPQEELFLGVALAIRWQQQNVSDAVVAMATSAPHVNIPCATSSIQAVMVTGTGLPHLSSVDANHPSSFIKTLHFKQNLWFVRTAAGVTRHRYKEVDLVQEHEARLRSSEHQSMQLM